MTEKIHTNQKTFSDTVYIFKTLAIVSVAFAHSVRVSPDVQYATDLIGIVGVPIFFICAGLYFNPDSPAPEFWLKKAKNIIVPLLLYGALTFVVSDRPFSLAGMVKWTLGCGTWLYFVSFLLCFFVFFRLFKHPNVPKAVFVLWLAYYLLSQFISMPQIPAFGNGWHNPLVRIGYFACGMLLKTSACPKEILENRKLSIASSILTVLLPVIIVTFRSFDIPGILIAVFKWSAIIAGFCLADALNKTKFRNLMIDIGKQTYMIYFLHMQFGNGVSKLMFNWWPLSLEWVVLFIHPIVAVLSVYIGICVLRRIIIKTGMTRYMWIIGMR